MLEPLRRLHPRGPGARGVVVDAEGAMLGPDCVLVHRTPQGYRALPAEQARAIQAILFDHDVGPDWLFEQCRSKPPPGLSHIATPGASPIGWRHPRIVSLSQLGNTSKSARGIRHRTEHTVV
jgi:hypothetical protein